MNFERVSWRYGVLVWLVMLVALTAMSGCQTVRDLVDTDRTVKQRIRDAEILIAAGYKKVAEDRRAGILTKEESLSRIAEIDSIDSKLSTAKDLLAGGNDQAAGKTLDLVNSLLLEYRKKLAAEARQ